MKRILIIGKNSYLGKSMYEWLCQQPDKYEAEIVASRNYEWKKADFSSFDSIIDYAGIAHINNITPDMKNLFYAVNRDLTIEIGKQAKKAGVKHFVYFSSMNVYGDYCNDIADRGKENPGGFYGDSKLQGDVGLKKLEDETFVVAHIRPPFVYGKGCSGNYNMISKIAKKTPIFPNYQNKKSMIYIDNLCEFIRMIVDDGIGGVFTPQNRELVSTVDLVREIALNEEHKIWFTSLFNPAVSLGKKWIKKVRKAFANDCYALEISDYYDFKYCVTDFKRSIRITEGKEK